MRLVLATHNKNKLKEVQSILGCDFEIISLSEIGFFDEIEETGSTFAENALIKARAVYEFCSLPVIADDSGLCVSALDGEPGIYSARYAAKNGIEGENADLENIRLLLKNLEKKEDRSAKFVCNIAYVDCGGEYVFEGEVAGIITSSPMGDGGFGYDPVFFYAPMGKTMGEMTGGEKDGISHRYNALLKLREHLFKKSGKNV